MRIIDPKTAVQLLHGEPGSAATKGDNAAPNTNGKEWGTILRTDTVH